VKELELVVLTHDVAEAGLAAGDIGAIVYSAGDDRYEVEFVIGSGSTVAVLSLTGRDVRAVAPGEILHARAMGASR
jgi:Domain of unknown function (DUF4926)